MGYRDGALLPAGARVIPGGPAGGLSDVLTREAEGSVAGDSGAVSAGRGNSENTKRQIIPSHEPSRFAPKWRLT